MMVRLISISGFEWRAVARSLKLGIFLRPICESETIVRANFARKLVAIVQAIAGKRAPQFAIPVDGLAQGTAALAGLLCIDQCAGDLAEQPVLGLARIFRGCVACFDMPCGS